MPTVLIMAVVLLWLLSELDEDVVVESGQAQTHSRHPFIRSLLTPFVVAVILPAY